MTKRMYNTWKHEDISKVLLKQKPNDITAEIEEKLAQNMMNLV